LSFSFRPAAGGAFSVTGSLVYGIGTQANNGLGSAKVLAVDASGNITTIFGGQSYPSSFIDSGSNGIYFLDAGASGLPLCQDSADFYCPATPQALSATNRGAAASPSPRCSMGTLTRSMPLAAFNETLAEPRRLRLGFFLAGACSRPSRARARRGARGRTLRIDRRHERALDLGWRQARVPW
jgi:hypothetical protein